MKAYTLVGFGKVFFELELESIGQGYQRLETICYTPWK